MDIDKVFLAASKSHPNQTYSHPLLQTAILLKNRIDLVSSSSEEDVYENEDDDDANIQSSSSSSADSSESSNDEMEVDDEEEDNDTTLSSYNTKTKNNATATHKSTTSPNTTLTLYERLQVQHENNRSMVLPVVVLKPSTIPNLVPGGCIQYCGENEDTFKSYTLLQRGFHGAQSVSDGLANNTDSTSNVGIVSSSSSSNVGSTNPMSLSSSSLSSSSSIDHGWSKNRIYTAKENETPANIAAITGVPVQIIVALNRSTYTGIQHKSKLMESTSLLLPPESDWDWWLVVPFETNNVDIIRLKQELFQQANQYNYLYTMQQQQLQQLRYQQHVQQQQLQQQQQ